MKDNMYPSNTYQDGERNREYKSQMLEAIIGNLEVGVYVSNYYTGEIIFVNQKTVDLLQNKIKANELIGKTCWNVLGGYSERCEFCSYEKLIDKNGEPSGPYTWEHYFEGYEFWGKVINQVIKWVDGTLAQITVFYDITDMKKMQQLVSEHVRVEEQWKMQQNLQTVLDSLPMPIRIVDIETANITYVNKKFLEKFEYKTPEDVIDRHVSIIVPYTPDKAEAYQSQLNEVLTSIGTHNSEIEYTTSTGKTFCGMLSSCIIDYNGRKSSVGIIADLTEEKEQKLLLMQAAEKEREANKLKSSFLSNMSHEIRTPMNAIIGLTEIELRKSHSHEEIRVYEKINSSAKNLLQIINDILDLSKIEANKVEIHPVEFELEDVLNSVLLVVAPRLENKQVELLLNLSLNMPQMLIGDKTRLWQILRNLLDNAAKFTENGSIILTVFENKELSTGDSISVSFSVTDTGIGMNEEQSIKVFLPYEQIHDDFNMRSAGSGLGLPISKQLCELMGGVMAVESRPNYGTTMKFIIPFTRSQNTEINLHSLNKKLLSKLKVLIVDDSTLSIHTMKELLNSCGMDSHFASSGEEAIKIVYKQNGEPPFDIIVLDYVMKEMNGLECAKFMRQHLQDSTKILILTAYENLLNKEELALYGVDDVIEKPFVPKYFIQKLANVLDKKLNQNEINTTAFMTFKDTKVLVCEDNEINQEIISTMLEEFEIDVTLAENGKLGIELISNNCFDLVFMDLHMPVMDGYSASKFIRSIAEYDDMPIISLTADAMVETLNECLSLGINDIITKPTSFEDVQRMLLKWLPKNKRCR